MAQTVRNPRDPGDPWIMANGPSYTPDTFYVRSVDGKGHSETLHVKISKQVVAVIQELIQSGDLGDTYRTTHDFVRDAIIHRAKYLADNKGLGKLDVVLTGETLMSKMQHQKEISETRENFITQFQAQLEYLDFRSQYGDMLDLMDEASVLAFDWQHTRHGKALAEVIKRYDHIRNRAALGSVSQIKPD